MTDPPTRVARTYTPTALPSTTARLLAFVAILLGGLCGALIGYSVAELQCEAGEAPPPATADAGDADSGSCDTVAGIGAVVGGAAGAGGVAVISVLVLRAMAEWRRELEPADDGPSA